MRIVCQEGLLPGANVRERFAACKEYGFDGIEPRGASVRENSALYRELSQEYDLPVTSLCLGWEGCMLDPDPKVRRKAMDGMIELLQIGDTLGGVGLVVPPLLGYRQPILPDLSPLANGVTLEKQLLVLLLQEIAAQIQDLKSVFVLEPLNRYEQHFPRTVADGVEIAGQVQSRNIGVLADFFHMNIEEANIEATLRDFAGKYHHVHLADSNRLLPGQGHLDFPRYIRALVETGYDGVMALECGIGGDPKVELPRCRKYLTDLIVQAQQAENAHA